MAVPFPPSYQCPACGHVAPIPAWQPTPGVVFARTCPACGASHDASDLRTLLRPPRT